MTLNKGFTLGQMETQFVWIGTQLNPYISSEYVVLDQDGYPIIMEVIETISLGMISETNLPKGISLAELTHLHFDFEKVTYFAKVKVLDHLTTPVPPHQMLRPATFKEVEPFLNSTDPSRSLVLGVIKGTELLQNLLPSHLQNIVSIMERRQIHPQNGIPFLFDFYKFTDMPNIGIFGGAGSGKSTALRSVVEEAMRHRLPGIFLDPHSEFSFNQPMPGIADPQQAKFKDAYEVLTVGEDVGISFEELSTAELLRLFSFFDPSPVMEAAIRTLHQKGDTRLHLKDKLLIMKKGFEEDKKPPHLREEDVLTLDEQMVYLRYKEKISGLETIQALLWRFEQLEATQIFNKNTLRIEQGILNRKIVVIRGEAFKTELLASYIIRKLYYKRVAYENARQENPTTAPSFFPGFLIFMDEAHRYAPKTKRTHPTRDLLVETAREGRKFGVYLGVATQRAASLDETLTAQLNTKFIFRTTNAQDMEVFRAEANLTDADLRLLPNLTSGHCFASSAMFSKNFAVQFKAPLTVAPKSDNPFDQLPPLNEETPEMIQIRRYLMTLPNGSIRQHQLGELLTQLVAQFGTHWTTETLLETLNRMGDRGDLAIIPTMIGQEFKLLKPVE